MSRRSLVPALLLLTAAWPVAAQESAASAPAADSAAQPAPKKKGMFGKLKSIAGNKTVQSVAKVAACTMVPGGQFVAAGIDAASAAGDKNAAGAATGAAGAATGSACFGGMPGAGAAAAGAGMGSVPGLAGTAASGAAAMTAMAAMSQVDAQPGTTAPPGELSAKDEKKMRSMLKKQGMSDEQINSTIAMYKQQSQPEPEPAAEGSRFGGQQNQPPTVPGGGSAAPVGLPDDYDAQVMAGRLVLIDLPWKGSTADLIVGTEEGVKASFVKIVESLNHAQGSYRVDVYVTEIDKGIAQARATAIVLFLTNAGLPAEEKLGGKATIGAKSKQPRVEIVRN
jgi:hypothetical protein